MCRVVVNVSVIICIIVTTFPTSRRNIDQADNISFDKLTISNTVFDIIIIIIIIVVVVTIISYSMDMSMVFSIQMFWIGKKGNENHFHNMRKTCTSTSITFIVIIVVIVVILVVMRFQKGKHFLQPHQW